MERQEQYAALFGQLVAMLHFAAMQQMGKIKNPVTDAIERNLEGARHTIDTLDMLQERTRGNLSPEEAQFLKQTLQELKLNFVDEVAKGDSPPAQAEGGASS
ncbi:MAG: hypothetical protein H6Q28_1742 [Bacteroidetes bacterium]|nr:hypothetical protein [Bacteroidota bacterium]MBP1678516.1 hypothetical protein [Bacteroidota bacterium]